VPQRKLRLLVSKKDIIVPFRAIEEKERSHYKVTLRRYYWPCIKEVITHFVKAWVDAE
jgi:hypothetical protein